ncbi:MULTISPECIES: hypothetical protein [unclassified Sulfuricurvum]|uniref:hypothetical protein n=1 Tax=unclassified Sulfuricurvum TaxID=2632390 RepID=UPI000299712A|nr:MULTISPECIES: hypothetical protein [unclassified Sulfuricurvum]OHD83696.1 MAG: hypothetical protein A3D90_05080 [Sulfuricurvum sp. RIFCSPHIGHO2_02_FULL_43_9]OHD86261.1 MAG: hypothetical protein A3I60_03865 [Sulfuricurvum sp. RIFCSPLOWO2_02_FULL_43_45]OHD87582.1 MAG: hypothetical protein A2Y52_05290 [Sulfuricurvum sp. RIFCSPLOWO2_02_43_6]OHD87638.1 MAG: hypothetical protein A3J39_08630 [Sulfuricurvum sp. RIFCSPHIGHO2_12_FULL_44_8]AFV98049.1 hypothetical protein B649_08685 [Candidatus Sulfuri
MWLTKLKTALVLEETDRISTLLDEMPQFDTIEQMEEAAFLLQQSKTLLEEKKMQTAQTLQQLKNALDFLKSTQEEPPSSLNLKF